MKRLKGIALAAFAGCISIALLPNIQADTWNKKTILPAQTPSAATPQPAQSEPSQPVELSETAERQTNTPAEPQQALPQTASGLPLISLIGIVSLAVFVAFRSRSSSK